MKKQGEIILRYNAFNFEFRDYFYMPQKIMKWIIFGISVLSFHVGISQANEPIHFGILYFYPPFVYNSKVGFDIALAQDLCKEMQAQCVFTPMSLENAQKSLKTNQIDALISAVSITTDRQKIYNITKPYLIGHAAFIGLADKHYPLTLDGLKIGVVHASTFERYLENTPGLKAKIIPYAYATDSIAALGKNEVDLVLIDAPVGEYWVNHSDTRLAFIGEPFSIPFDQGYGILISPSNPQLRDEMNQALIHVTSDGRYQRLFTLYFGSDKNHYVAVPGWMKV